MEPRNSCSQYRQTTYVLRWKKSIVEAHLLDFVGDLYGDDATLTFHERIRPERKFAGLEEFQLQLEIDISQIRELLT